MPQFCRLYGLDTKLNDPIDAVAGVSVPMSAIDLEITLRALPIDASGRSGRRHWYGARPGLVSTLLGTGSFINFSFRDDCQFVVDGQGREVWAVWPENFPLDYVLPYLLGPMMGITLRIRGVTCLHASAVSVAGRAIVMVGQAGAGKSTTAAAFASLGFPIFTDDVVPLQPRQNAFYVEPGYPRICLWPRSVEALFGSSDALPLITEGWEKRYLSLQDPGYHFSSQALPLGAVYVLGDRSEGPFEATFSDVDHRHALLELIANTYAGTLPLRQMQAQDLQVFSRIISQVPIRRISSRGGVSEVKQLANAIADDFMRNVPVLATK